MYNISINFLVPHREGGDESLQLVDHERYLVYHVLHLLPFKIALYKLAVGTVLIWLTGYLIPVQ
jgi:hypothetical protein